MSRLILLTLLLIFTAFTSAQVVTFNTPSNKVAVNANIILTWQYNAPTTAGNGTATGILSIVNSGTKDTTVIDNNVPLAPKSYQWKVNVPPGNYYLTLNDGTGDKATGNFDVFDPSAGATPTSGSAPTGSSGSSSTGSPSSNPPSPASTVKSGAAPVKISFTGSDKILFSFIVVTAAIMHFT